MYFGVPQHVGKRSPWAHKAHTFYKHLGREFRGCLSELDNCDWLPWATFKIIGQLEFPLNFQMKVVSFIWSCSAHLEEFEVFPGIVTSLSVLTLGKVVPCLGHFLICPSPRQSWVEWKVSVWLWASLWGAGLLFLTVFSHYPLFLKTISILKWGLILS